MYIARDKTAGEAGEKPLRIGTKELAWHKNVSFRVYKVEKAAAEGPARGGPEEGRSAPSKPIVGKLLLKDAKVEMWGPKPTKEELVVGELTRSFWAIDPSLTAKWPTGKYVIEAVFDTTDKQESHPYIFHGKLSSNEVTITINEPADDKAKVEVLMSQAEYCMYQQNNYDDAIGRFRQVLRLNPEKKEIHCHLGRAYELKGDIPTAIEEYRAYVDWVRSLKRPRTGKDDINDHADIIESTIRALEKRSAEKE
jgi:tetratricopeptide (TPR) repeat protein